MKVYTISGLKKDYYKLIITEDQMRSEGYDCPKEYALERGVWSEDKIYSKTEGDVEIYYISEGVV